MERDDPILEPAPERPMVPTPPAHPRTERRCPRCGGMMGALRPGADGRDSDVPTDLYCACCGLVLPDAG